MHQATVTTKQSGRMMNMQRSTQTNTNSYIEVTLEYRKHRAARLDKQNFGDKTDRIVCPMVEASRSKSAYGQQFLPGLKSDDLAQFATALEISPFAMKSIAYLSGKFTSIPANIIKGEFDDQAINGGFIHSLKNGVHTGIFRDTKFDQDRFDNFISSFHPDLKGTPLSNEWLYSEQADTLYFEDSHLPQVLEYNESLKTSKRVGLGLKLSTFEMQKLLLNVLGQKLSNHPSGQQGILIRDIHDLYKYGFFPVPIEEKAESNNLLVLD